MFQGTSSRSKSGEQSANELRRLIDLRIANLRESIRILNGERNALLPISKLPVEILSKIFSLHQQMVMKEQYKIETLAWIGITHVSQRWREIALNFPGFWIHIPFRHPQWTKEMIERSQNASLIVTATYDPAKNESQAKLLRSFLQQHLSRVQVLDIRQTRPRLIARLFQDIQPTSVPCLSTLSLSMEGQTPGTEASSVHESFQIVHSRLLNTQSLRKVNASIAFGWNVGLLSGLTHLSLGNGDRKMTRIQTSQRDFLDALRRMPTLQSLALNGPVLPDAVDTSLLESVHLPDLRDLSVVDTASTIEFFLQRVTFPPTTHTVIGCRHLHSVLRPADISPVFVPLKRVLFERRRALKLHNIKFSCSEDPEDWEMINLRFQGWVSPSPSSSLEGFIPDFPSDNPDFTFFVQWLNSDVDVLPPEMAECCVTMFEVFPQEDVVSLSLSSYDIKDTWFTPFSRKIAQLPTLNNLFLEHVSSAQFLLELDRDVLQEGVNELTTAFPALLYVDFCDCEIVLKSLYECLKKRSERGLGPRKLKVDLRGLDRHYTLLEKVVQVVWERVAGDPDPDFDGSEG